MSARKVAFRGHALVTGDDLPVLEDEQGGDRGNAAVGGEFLVRVHVDLAHLEVPGQRLDGRVHGPAGPHHEAQNRPDRLGADDFLPLEFVQEDRLAPWFGRGRRLLSFYAGAGHWCACPGAASPLPMTTGTARTDEGRRTMNTVELLQRLHHHRAWVNGNSADRRRHLERRAVAVAFPDWPRPDNQCSEKSRHGAG